MNEETKQLIWTSKPNWN